jgi:hypothetical protein
MSYTDTIAGQSVGRVLFKAALKAFSPFHNGTLNVPCWMSHDERARTIADEIAVPTQQPSP